MLQHFRPHGDQLSLTCWPRAYRFSEPVESLKFDYRHQFSNNLHVSAYDQDILVNEAS
jgi:hypothetical protein